jgi:hypothetical protein
LDFGFNDAGFLLMIGSVALNLTKSMTDFFAKSPNMTSGKASVFANCRHARIFS